MKHKSRKFTYEVISDKTNRVLKKTISLATAKAIKKNKIKNGVCCYIYKSWKENGVWCGESI